MTITLSFSGADANRSRATRRKIKQQRRNNRLHLAARSAARSPADSSGTRVHTSHILSPSAPAAAAASCEYDELQDAATARSHAAEDDMLPCLDQWEVVERVQDAAADADVETPGEWLLVNL